VRSPPEEVWLFIRTAIFGIAIGSAYWFLTYETAGTVLLLGIGFGSALVVAVLYLGSRRLERPGSTATPPDRPFADERGRVPSPGWAPLGVGLGLAVTALGGAFGPWLVLLGLPLVLIAGHAWLAAAMREADATEAPEGQSARSGRPNR
jgi:hypothetical protein